MGLSRFQAIAAQRWKSTPNVARWIIVTVVVLVMAARLALPFAIKSYVNKKLAALPDYGGHLEGVGVRLHRGAYQIRDLRIFRRAGNEEIPLFTEPLLDLSIEWREVLHGAIVGRVVMTKPELNFVDEPNNGKSQNGAGVRWDKMLEGLFPFKLNRLEIHDGRVHFQNPRSSPPVDIFINDLSATATNLTNTRDLAQALPAGITAKGGTLGGGGFDLHLKLDPLAPAPTFEMTTQLTNVNLTALNDFLRAYGKFDVERGRFALFTSMAAKEGNFEGYLKVFFEDLDVFAWEKERKKNVLEKFWQAIVGTLTTVFKNQPKDRLATTVPISGTFDKTDVHVWPAVTSLLRNAFIRALVPQLDGKVTVDEVPIEGKKAATGGANSKTGPPPQKR